MHLLLHIIKNEFETINNREYIINREYNLRDHEVKILAYH